MSTATIKKLFFIIIAFRFTASQAQDSLTYALSAIASTNDGPGITIGQTVPDIRIDKIVNYPAKNIHLSGFKGKVVILDFWHQFCTVCIKEFPKLTALQKQFGDSLLILPVTFQSKASVLDFMDNRKAAGKQMMLPTIVEDTLLHKLFPHAGDPHEVWIDKQGKVCAITNHLAVTKENISRLIRTGTISLPVKNDLTDFDFNKPLLVNNNGGADSAFVFRSLFTTYLEGVRGSGSMAVQTEKATRIMIQNQTMESMYKIVYSGAANSPFRDMNDLVMGKRTIFETKDSSRNNYWVASYNAGYEQNLNFSRRNLYSYDLILPSRIRLQKAYDIALSEMDVFFDKTSFVEKRKIKCLSLIRTEVNDIFSTSDGQEIYKIDEDNGKMVFINKSISFLTEKINSNYELPLVIDETGYHHNIDITLNYKSNSLDMLQQTLEKYGLALVEKYYELEVLVIKDNN